MLAETIHAFRLSFILEEAGSNCGVNSRFFYFIFSGVFYAVYAASLQLKKNGESGFPC